LQEFLITIIFIKTKNSNEAKLQINNFTKNNDGYYYCIASNELGEQAIEAFRVIIKKNDDLSVIKVEPKSMHVLEASSIKINYTIPVSSFNFKLKIFRIAIKKHCILPHLFM
jgi:hypothetical protein